jgi:probable HAF family extracellular repeat protein
MLIPQRSAIPAYTIIFCVMMCGVPAVAGTYTYSTLDPPGYNNSTVNGVNDNDQVVGEFSDTSGNLHGFVWTNGNFTQINGPSGALIIMTAINASGIAAGWYSVGRGGRVSFTYNTATSAMTLLNLKSKYHASPTAINASGTVLGNTEQRVAKNDYSLGGFTITGAKVTYLTPPGTGANTAFNAINDKGIIVGGYRDSIGLHSFSYDKGVYITFDPNGSAFDSAYFITKSGVIGGTFDGHGYVKVGSTITQYDYPGTQTGVGYTGTIGVGTSGTVFGSWDDSNYLSHGYVFVSGAYYNINVPGAAVTNVLQVNDNDSIVGTYQAAGGQPYQGFIAQCPAAQRPCTQ